MWNTVHRNIFILAEMCFSVLLRFLEIIENLNA